jgi:hypothetical protein
MDAHPCGAGKLEFEFAKSGETLPTIALREVDRKKLEIYGWYA